LAIVYPCETVIVPPDSFIGETLAQELHGLTRHMAECKGVWHRAAEALRSGNLDEMNLALDSIIKLHQGGR
jgi:hypothetical protein